MDFLIMLSFIIVALLATIIIPKLIVKHKVKQLKVGDIYVSVFKNQREFPVRIVSITNHVYYVFIKAPSKDAENKTYNMPKENFVINWKRVK